MEDRNTSGQNSLCSGGIAVFPSPRHPGQAIARAGIGEPGRPLAIFHRWIGGSPIPDNRYRDFRDDEGEDCACRPHHDVVAGLIPLLAGLIPTTSINGLYGMAFLETCGHGTRSPNHQLRRRPRLDRGSSIPCGDSWSTAEKPNQLIRLLDPRLRGDDVRVCGQAENQSRFHAEPNSSGLIPGMPAYSVVPVSILSKPTEIKGSARKRHYPACGKSHNQGA